MESKLCKSQFRKIQLMTGEEYVTLAHAAETLARTLYTFGNQGDQATTWDLVTGDVREYYINRALEELKK